MRAILDSMGTYEFFDHMADVGIRVQADSPEELFLSAARALMAWMGPLPDGPTAESKVSVVADDPEELLVRWLQEVLCIFHLRHTYLTGAREISIDIEHPRVEASVVGIAWDNEKRLNYQEVKAITYHQLRVERQDSIWLASVILDI